MILSRSLPALIICGFLVSCTALDLPISTSLPPLITETPLQTPTIIWFPPTATFTPQPVSTQPPPTPEQKPGISAITLTDDFSDETFWDTAVSDQASAAISRNRLTIAVQPGIYLISQRSGIILSDFYAELTARPSLCRGEDDYGLAVRSKGVAYYRFALSCNGTVRAERVSVGRRAILQEAIPSGDAPLGAPGEVRIGVWAAGTEMRLFLNNRYQFSVNDLNYLSGTIGVFARAAGDTPVTVTFSDLVIREVTYIPPTKTTVPTP